MNPAPAPEPVPVNGLEWLRALSMAAGALLIGVAVLEALRRMNGR